ncbi:hypothetical protein DENSPDRAFT_837350 [Dentipellis sp. KUC8613]|nr:hypothetical protein DENSPDRAFT_837350 [Dentipellis sp. KUC8613]
MSSALAPIQAVYDITLQPIGFLSWLGASVSWLDLLGAFRLAVVLRQLREGTHKEYIRTADGDSSGRPGKDRAPPEHRGRVRDIATTLVMVYGGEAVIGPWLGFQPSFLVDGVIPMTFLAAHALVELLPSVPDATLALETFTAIIDAFTRAMLLCDFIPKIVTRHISPAVSESPWTLLLTALITANAGPFFTFSFSLLQPTPVSLTTPPELLPYGWTSTDLWIAPLVSGLYATLTHAQPFFAELHTLLFTFFSPLGLAHMSYPSLGKDPVVESATVAVVDPETARAVCVLVMATAFVTRTVKNFGPGVLWDAPSTTQEHVKDKQHTKLAQRTHGGKKTKTQ